MNYSKMKKEDLINLIEELKIEKYGLSWDRETKPEKVVNDCKNHFPILKEFESEEVKQEYEHGILPMIDNKVNVGDKHILIEGDNYHALSVLNYTHNEKIDVIYIDPPYNTGSGDFKYNDKFVDREDTYKHSKWLNFMYKRLIIARELLKDTGSIFVQIGGDEFAQLKLLMDIVFGEDNFRNCIIWEFGLGGSSPKYFPAKHDYIFFYSKTDKWNFNPIMTPATSNAMKGQMKKLDDVWTDIPNINNMAHERTGFNTQKPVKLIKRILSATTNKDSIVLDFFAGSGTTGHAVLELNKEDGGNRQFILCTNNEGGICKDICYPRLKKSINGYKTPNGKKIEALGGSFKYFKTDVIKQREHETQDKINISQVCAEMLCLKENIFNLEKNTKNYKIYSSDNKDKWLIVYYDMYGDAVKECEDEINKLTGKKIIYIFTLGGPPFLWDESIERLEKDKTNDIRLIPERILMAYRDVINMS